MAQELIDALHEQDKIDQMRVDLELDQKSDIGHNHDTSYVKLDGTSPMSGDLDLGSNGIKNISDGTQTTDAASFGQTSTMIQNLRSETETGLQSKEPTVTVGSAGQVWTTNAAADGKEWTTIDVGDEAVWGNITGTLSNQDDLQDALDSKSPMNHTHGYVLKAGDTMTGNLNIKKATGYSVLALYESDDGSGNGTMAYKRLDGSQSAEIFLNRNNDPAQEKLIFRKQNENGAAVNEFIIKSNGASISNNNPTEPEDLVTKDFAYLKADHIDISAGSADGGKPILLNSTGVIDVSMLETSSFYPVGAHDPSAGVEYPDTTGESFGAFWYVDQFTAPDGSDEQGDYYEFKTSLADNDGGITDLIGKRIHIGDLMVWSATGWGIMASEMNPTLYMKLDKSQHFDNNGSPLVVNGKVSFIEPGSVTGEAIEYDQLISHTSNINNPHSITAIQIGAEPTVNVGTARQIWATNQAADGKEWIDVPISLPDATGKAFNELATDGSAEDAAEWSPFRLTPKTLAADYTIATGSSATIGSFTLEETFTITIEDNASLIVL